MSDETYLGDGLYASFDGWQFCLRMRTPSDGGDHVVYLEPAVMVAFDSYRAEVMRKIKAGAS